jgi:hypothetical protein
VLFLMELIHDVRSTKKASKKLYVGNIDMLESLQLEEELTLLTS